MVWERGTSRIPELSAGGSVGFLKKSTSNKSPALRLNILEEFSSRKIPMTFCSATVSFQHGHVS